MITWKRNFWWILAIFLTVLPFGLNYVININCGFKVIGEPKDWLMFWGTYMSSVASAIMAIFTYRIIKQNDDFRKGELLFRILKLKNSWFLEISNIGNGVAQDINITVNDKFTNLLYEPNKICFEEALSKRFCLKQNEDAKIFIDYSEITGRCSSNFNEDGNPTHISDGYTQEELEKIKNEPIEISVIFRTLGQIQKNKQTVVINNFMLLLGIISFFLILLWSNMYIWFCGL